MSQQNKITAVIQETWELVFAASNKVLNDYRTYGFSGLDLIPDPNIHQMINQISAVEKLLDLLIDSVHNTDDIPHDDYRKLLNSKKQITTMQAVALSLKAGLEADVKEGIGELRRQLVV